MNPDCNKLIFYFLRLNIGGNKFPLICKTNGINFSYGSTDEESLLLKKQKSSNLYQTQQKHLSKCHFFMKQ